MSAERSSSAVRNLRTIFETRESAAVAQEQRSRSGSAEPNRGRRPLSKVRSSFVPVEVVKTMDGPVQKTDPIAEQETDNALVRESSASLRRPSFSANAIDSEELELKRVVTHESEKRDRDHSVQETIPEQAIESSPDDTPSLKPQSAPVQASENVKPSSDAVEVSQPPLNPDKPITGAEEPAELRPADPTSEAAVTGGEALKEEPIETVKTPSAKTAMPSKTSARITKPEMDKKASETPRSSNVNSRHDQQKPLQVESTSTIAHSSSTAEPKTETKPLSKPTSKPLNRKVSRGSLSATTARTTTHHEPMPTRTKPREATKPAEISSHLLAPTAASRARTEGDHPPSNGTTAKATTKPPRASLASKPTPRTSLAGKPGPDSADENTASRKSTVPNESFLERMMRPTAASQSRATEKFEAKSPPQKSKHMALTSKRTVGTSGEAADTKDVEPELDA